MLEIVARSASDRPASPSPANSTNAPTTPNARSISVIDEHEVGRGRGPGQLAVEADADDPRHRLVQRLAEQDGLGLDPADAVAEDAQPVDHRRVRVGADERVREGDAAVRRRRGRVDDRREVLEVDLVDDPGPGRHDPQVAERGLRPAQELVALAVALVLALDVEGERAGAAPRVDLDRVVDHEVRRHERVDARGVAAERRHRVAHRREVDDRGHAREVLEDDARGHERDLGLAAAARAATRRGPRRPPRGRSPPPAWRSTFSRRILRVTGARPRSIPRASAGGRERVEAVEVREAGAERSSGAEGVGRGHGLISTVGDRAMRVRPRTARYTRWVEAYSAHRQAPDGDPR